MDDSQAGQVSPAERQQQVCDAPKCSGLHAHHIGSMSMKRILIGSCSLSISFECLGFVLSFEESPVFLRKFDPILELNGNQQICNRGLELLVVIVLLELGMPSMCKSSACADCVPVVCTHRPSLPLMTKG